MNLDCCKLFENGGGEFVCSHDEFCKKVNKIKLLILDWDGVFNSGVKNENLSSYFSEVDALGINMLRFAFSLKTGKILNIGIISGEKNQMIEKFSLRQHLNFRCMAFKNKIEGFNFVLKQYNLKPYEVAFVYDDIIDLSVASCCGLRFQIKRSATPMFNNFVKANQLADYIPSNTGATFAVREICELMMSALGVYNEAVTARYKFEKSYDEYISNRNQIQTVTYSPSTTY